MKEIVEARNLKKVYPNGTVALKNVNISIRSGEFIGIMGPSGSGKSTLLHILGGLDRPSEGYVKVFGEEIHKLSEDKLADFRKRRIAYIFQFYYLLEDFTVLENLTVVAQMAGIKEPKKEPLTSLNS